MERERWYISHNVTGRNKGTCAKKLPTGPEGGHHYNSENKQQWEAPEDSGQHISRAERKAHQRWKPVEPQRSGMHSTTSKRKLG